MTVYLQRSLGGVVTSLVQEVVVALGDIEPAHHLRFLLELTPFKLVVVEHLPLLLLQPLNLEVLELHHLLPILAFLPSLLLVVVEVVKVHLQILEILVVLEVAVVDMILQVMQVEQEILHQHLHHKEMMVDWVKVLLE